MNIFPRLMLPSPDASIANLIAEPVIALDGAGRLCFANKAAYRKFDGLSVGDLFSVHSMDQAELAALLRRFSASAEPSLGTLRIATAAGEDRYRVSGARLPAFGAKLMIGLQFAVNRVEDFSALSAQVKALNAEIHQHRVARRKLEEALAANQTLFRELQHRVKNHLQVILSMIGLARRRTQNPEAVALLDLFDNRVGAIAQAQQLMYLAQSMSGVPADQLITAIVERFRDIVGAGVVVTVESTADELSNETAPPLALILNELLSNAAKYAAREGRLRLDVAFRREGQMLSQTVQDDGPGFPDGQDARGSGLRLVRGLCRQIGGALLIETNAGARCTVRFRQTPGGVG